jgi:hypothetical protein
MLRLRQLVLVAHDLRPVEQQLVDDFGLEVCYRDPGVGNFGLRHGLYTIGDQLLEVVSPKQYGTTAARYLDRRGGDGGYMVIVQLDDLDAQRERMADLDVRIAFEASTTGLKGLHLHPADVGGAILSLDEPDPPESWAWAGPDWAYHSSDAVSAMTAVEIQADDPGALAGRWAAILDRPAIDCTIECDDAAIRFVEATDGRGDGLAAIDLAVTDRVRVGETRAVGGVRFNLV